MTVRFTWSNAVGKCTDSVQEQGIQGGSKWNTPPDNMQYLRNQWLILKILEGADEN